MERTCEKHAEGIATWGSKSYEVNASISMANGGSVLALVLINGTVPHAWAFELFAFIPDIHDAKRVFASSFGDAFAVIRGNNKNRFGLGAARLPLAHARIVGLFLEI